MIYNCKLCSKQLFQTKKNKNLNGLCKKCFTRSDLEKQKIKKSPVLRFGQSVQVRKKNGEIKWISKEQAVLKYAFYESKEWRKLRYDTLIKFGRKCMVCFRTNIEMHVDHIKPISKFPEFALDIQNLQVLCMDCNLGKGNSDSIDWRPNGKV